MKFSVSHSNHILSLNYEIIAYFPWRRDGKYKNLGSKTRKKYIIKNVGDITNILMINEIIWGSFFPLNLSLMAF